MTLRLVSIELENLSNTKENILPGFPLSVCCAKTRLHPKYTSLYAGVQCVYCVG